MLYTVLFNWPLRIKLSSQAISVILMWLTEHELCPSFKPYKIIDVRAFMFASYSYSYAFGHSISAFKTRVKTFFSLGKLMAGALYKLSVIFISDV